MPYCCWLLSAEHKGKGITSNFDNIGVQMNAIKLALIAYVISVKRTSAVMSFLFGYFIFREKGTQERLMGVTIMMRRNWDANLPGVIQSTYTGGTFKLQAGLFGNVLVGYFRLPSGTLITDGFRVIFKNSAGFAVIGKMLFHRGLPGSARSPEIR